MIWLSIVVLVLIFIFGGVLLFGAPYLPTLTPQVNVALEITGLKAGQTLLELGCGDGKVLIAAAKKGIIVRGYELNPILVIVAWIRTRKYRDQVTVVWGDFWRQDWPAADAIFVFLVPRYMKKLNNKCMHYSHRPVKLISFAFAIPGKKADLKKAGVYLYTYG
jgi:hypothetical protein